MSHSHQTQPNANEDDIKFKNDITDRLKIKGLFIPKFTIFLNKDGGQYINY